VPILSRRTKFRIGYTQDRLIGSLRPFIIRLAERISETQSLDASVQETLAHFPRVQRYFDLQPGLIDKTFQLRNEFLFADWSINELDVLGSERPFKLELAQATHVQLRQLGEFLLHCATGDRSTKGLRNPLDDELKAVCARMIDNGDLVEREEDTRLPFAPAGQPGVFRLQHASLLYRSRLAGVLVDPHLHSSFNNSHGRDITPADLLGKVNAVLISHFHGDHWFLPSLMMFPRDTLIVVPKVPGPSIICGDMKKMLEALGFINVVAADWYSEPIRVEDIEIFVLPFFGEQPLRYERPNDMRLRNWGNTYLIRCPFYTSWFLIDSGADAEGSMLEVSDWVRAKFPRIDFVLSNLRRFCVVHPIYINGGLNWLTLSPDQIRRFHTMKGHCITLGSQNVARICKTIGARYYLPYAHWWGELNAIPRTSEDTPGEDEMQLLSKLQEHLAEVGAPTRIVNWNIGGGFIPSLGDGYDLLSLGEPALTGR
jgi:hypothetical protein